MYVLDTNTLIYYFKGQGIFQGVRTRDRRLVLTMPKSLIFSFAEFIQFVKIAIYLRLS